MLEYFNIGFGAEAGVEILKRIQEEGKYSRKTPQKTIVNRLLKIAENSKEVLITNKYNPELILYYQLFSISLAKKDFFERSAYADLADKTIETLEKIKHNKQISKRDVKSSEKFFEFISNRCLSLQNYENPRF